MVILNSNTDPNHASHIALSPNTAIKVPCKLPPDWHCSLPWSVSPHFNMESSGEAAVKHIFKALQLCTQCKTNEGQIELSTQGQITPLRGSSLSAQSCPLSPFPLNLYSQTRNLPRKMGNTGCFMNLSTHSHITAHTN